MKVKLRVVFLVLISIISFLGCDAFVRKFTRKPKKESSLKQEVVILPEEYPSLFANKEEAYRYYFSFWQSWHTEFINSLVEKTPHKKKVFCLSEAIKNLNNMNDMLLDEKRIGLQKYISELKELMNKLSKDIYTTHFNWYINRAEIIRKNILRDYSYPKIKDYLK